MFIYTSVYNSNIKYKSKTDKICLNKNIGEPSSKTII